MTAYRIDLLTAKRYGARVIKTETIAVDGIPTRSEADRWRKLLANERPDALVVITAYNRPTNDD